jgi:glycosyltransferase involved in cell wall biosynthesis
VELAMRAVVRCQRDDVELHVSSLRGDEDVPDDPRIIATSYEMVPRADYDEQLRRLDALLMPFVDPDGDMLTTGTVGDAIGFGLPTIASSWPFLGETLGDAAVTYGRSEDELVACLDGLDDAALERAARAAERLQTATSWSAVAEMLWAELDRLGSARD